MIVYDDLKNIFFLGSFFAVKINTINVRYLLFAELILVLSVNFVYLIY